MATAGKAVLADVVSYTDAIPVIQISDVIVGH